MIKDRLLFFLADMEGPSSFAEYRVLLSAEVLQFPDDITVPSDPNSAYGRGWDTQFRLPRSPVGIEDAKSLILLEDTKPNAIGLGAERKFLFVQPLPRPMFPVDFYLAWGVCLMSFTTVSARMNAGIAKKGEWFVGEEGSEFTDGIQLFAAMLKCESMIGPGVTTAIEQLAYLAHAKMSAG